MQTKSFEKVRPGLAEFVESSPELSAEFLTSRDLQKHLLAFGQRFFANSGYAQTLSPYERALALRVIESSRLFCGLGTDLMATAACDEKRKLPEDYVSRFRTLMECLFPFLLVHRSMAKEFACPCRIPLDSPEAIAAIISWLASVDSVLAGLPADEPVVQMPVEPENPFLTESNLSLFQSLLGLLHRRATHDSEFVYYERAVVGFLARTGVTVEWPDGDICESTPEFRVVIDPSSDHVVDTLPCLRWLDSWLAGERVLPDERT